MENQAVVVEPEAEAVAPTVDTAADEYVDANSAIAAAADGDNLREDIDTNASAGSDAGGSDGQNLSVTDVDSLMDLASTSGGDNTVTPVTIDSSQSTIPPTTEKPPSREACASICAE